MISMTSPVGMKITSWSLIFIQIVSPLLYSINALADTRQLNHIEETIIGLESVVEGSDRIYSELPAPSAKASTPQAATAVPWTEQGLATPFAPLSGSTPAGQTSPGLPSLGSERSATAQPETDSQSGIASGVMQAGRILSDKHAADASLNYFKSLGEGLINQEINDWLNQKGTARISIDSDAKIAGDLLYPLAESSDSLVFTQLGMRAKDDRNTLNVGVGYRQYLDAWMYGVNTFYDYDYSGNNARLGIGTELWGDYLRLSANGYFGLTDWHQSDLSDMRDYDERPASGFDIRANAWLPAYPQIGGSLKYEKYFGKGVDLSGDGSPDDLEDNAQAVTVGLNYSPIPLVTLKAEQSFGDTNETNAGVNFTYRLGVPWHQQISPDSVDMMHSLMGSMQDLVDRNYDIVMQYRKQELLRISLPPQVNGRAAETIALPLTVQKAKYGLKEVDWTADASFYSHGGTLRKVSLTQAEVVLPAFAYNLPASPTQQYVIKAVGADQYGNKSNVTTTTITLAPSKNIVSALTVTPSGSLPANNSDYFTATAVVRDENNRPLVAQPITFSLENLKGNDGYSAATLFVAGRTGNTTLTVNTDNAGNATVNIRSKLAKQGTLRATMNNGNFKSAPLSFVADTATARVDALEILANKALADGHSSNKLQVTVKDLNGNPLSGARVELSASNNATLVNGDSVTTNSSGQAEIQVTSNLVGESIVTARINGTSKSQTVIFTADKTSAAIAEGNLTSTQDAVANGKATNIVTAIVTDPRGNPVADVNVIFTISPGASLKTLNATTGSDGIAKASVTSLKAATFTVKARIKESGNSAQTTSRFIADASTATLLDGNLVINPNGALSNGIATDGVEATVTDANGNLLSGFNVSFSVANGATLRDTAVSTGDDGKARTTLSSTRAGSYALQATVNGHSVSKTAMFIADSGTAGIASGDLRVTADNAKADGKATNAVEAKVTDATGNPVSGVAVSFTANSSVNVAVASAITNDQGIASTTLSSTQSGVAQVTATVKGASQSVNVTFMADSATATLSNLTVTTDNAIANGTATNALKAVVTDASGNPVSGITVTFRATNGGRMTLASVVTTTEGVAITTLTNTVAGETSVTATANDSSRSVTTTFIPDGNSATLTAANLTVTMNNALADGTAKNGVQAIVTDAYGNLVPGVTVRFSADNGATVIYSEAITNAQGVASTGLTSTVAGVARVTAVVNGESQSVDTTFVADGSTATITANNLTVLSDNAKADGQATNQVQAKVTDSQGNLIAGATVNFTASNGASITTASVVTDAQGLASTTLTNIHAGITKVTATVNDTSRSVDTTFMADGGTATIIDGNLTVTANNAKANGTATNAVQAIITDEQGNLVSGVTVSFSATNGAQLSTATIITDEHGLASTTLTNATAGVTVVSAAVNGNRQSVNTTFIADNSTARIISGNLKVTVDNAVADDVSTNEVQATVTDASGNVVPDAVVTFSVDNGATLSAASVTTNAQGIATTTLKNTHAGVTKVTATVNGSSQTVNTSFVADESTARILSGDMTVTEDNAKANGTATNAVQVKVTDANGNVVPRATVSFTVTNGARLTAASAITNAQGVIVTTLSSTQAGVASVTATVNDSAQSVQTTFVADKSTARIASGNLVVTTNNAKADGTATNAVQVTVTDASGNIVPDIAVNFTVDNGATLAAASAVTNAEGIITTTLNNIHAGVTKVTASVNGSSQTVNTIFVADENTARIIDGNLTVTVDNAKADGTATNAVRVKVTDASGNIVPAVEVTFAADNGASFTAAVITNAQGIATNTLTNIHAGVTKVTASINGSSQTVDTHFMADKGTARIINGDLTVTVDNAKANGTATNTVEAKVTDASGNIVPDVTVSFVVDNGATLVAASAVTNARGVATTTLKSIHAGVAKVTATVNGSNQSVNTTFVADKDTARIINGNLTVTVDNAKADGTSTNTVQAKVTDASGNLVPAIAVTFTADNGAIISHGSVTTDDQGVATVTLTNTLAGVTNVTASVNGTSQSVGTMFIANAITANVIQVTLNDTVVEKKANGMEYFTFTALVKDANNNVVPGATVNWAEDKGSLAVLQATSSVTDANGMTTMRLTSTTREALDIQVSASVAGGNVINADKKVSFKEAVVQLQGEIRNGVSNDPLPGVSVQLFASAQATTPLYQTTSGSDGTYSIANVPQGIYYIRASLTGFITLEQSLDLSEVTTLQKNIVLSPSLNGKAARIILTWDAEPKDLDAYLRVPSADNPKSLITVSGVNKAPSGADATLDRDDRNGYGPETITISDFHRGGVYCYSVSRYSSTPKVYTGAMVQLYLSDGTSRTFRIEDTTPPGANAAAWTVFRIDTRAEQFIVTPDNRIGNYCD
ncbi:Ig-like domain-containing protein [Enterobacteriaceae bacterium H16N7]|nr:Ig-like domain-containing protein [Dryocola clanedunensis]